MSDQHPPSEKQGEHDAHQEVSHKGHKEPEEQGHAGHGSMGDRGVTRPDMEHHEHGEMSQEHRQMMLVAHHRKTYWIYWTVILLGLWTLSSPFTLGYGDHPSSPPIPRLRRSG